MNVTDDRQTDHATEKCVAIGVIACRARSDSFEKRNPLSPENVNISLHLCKTRWNKHICVIV